MSFHIHYLLAHLVGGFNIWENKNEMFQNIIPIYGNDNSHVPNHQPDIYKKYLSLRLVACSVGRGSMRSLPKRRQESGTVETTSPSQMAMSKPKASWEAVKDAPGENPTMAHG